MLLNSDTSLISIIISKRKKERIHSTKCIKRLWKNPNGQPIRGHDFVYLPSWSLCWSPFTLGFRNQISSSSYPRPITQFNFIMSELGPWPDVEEKAENSLKYRWEFQPVIGLTGHWMPLAFHSWGKERDPEPSPEPSLQLRRLDQLPVPSSHWLMERFDRQVTAVPRREMTQITTHDHSSGAAHCG